MNKLICNVGEYSVVINKKKEFLILKLAKNKLYPEEKWMLPGGRLSTQDEPTLALQREIFEETGIKVEVIAPVHVALWGKQIPKYSVFFISKVKEVQKIKLSEEHIDAKWVSFNQLNNISWHNENSKIAVEKSKKFLDKDF